MHVLNNQCIRYISMKISNGVHIQWLDVQPAGKKTAEKQLITIHGSIYSNDPQRQKILRSRYNVSQDLGVVHPFLVMQTSPRALHSVAVVLKGMSLYIRGLSSSHVVVFSVYTLLSLYWSYFKLAALSAYVSLSTIISLGTH